VPPVYPGHDQPHPQPYVQPPYQPHAQAPVFPRPVAPVSPIAPRPARPPMIATPVRPPIGPGGAFGRAPSFQAPAFHAPAPVFQGGRGHR
jgi:hypothetical protein